MSESALSKHKLYYEDLAPRPYKKLKEGKTMSKASKAQATTTPTVTAGTPSKMETFKTILIVTMVAGALAFYGGMQFEKNQQAEVRNAVQAAQQAQAPAAEVKK